MKIIYVSRRSSDELADKALWLKLIQTVAKELVDKALIYIRMRDQLRMLLNTKWKVAHLAKECTLKLFFLFLFFIFLFYKLSYASRFINGKRLPIFSFHFQSRKLLEENFI
jgi:hypothetical protein